MQETIQLSAEIEINSPELYAILKETPVLLFDKNRTDTYITDFENYLQILKSQLPNRGAAHPKNISGVD
ncbi:MAG TPA: hypothetical protein VIS75_04665 [Chitinophagaceae bacterium]